MSTIDLRCGDCLILLHSLPDNSVDLCCADMPFGTTACKWDIPIPLQDFVMSKGKAVYLKDWLLHAYVNGIEHAKALKEFEYRRERGIWYHLKRVCKPTAAIVLFAQTPFSNILGSSNLPMLRYEWIWEKNNPTGHLNAKRMPMKAHENILVFYQKLPTYNPIKTQGHERKTAKRIAPSGVHYGKTGKLTHYDSTERYPRSVQKFNSDKYKNNLHPTQKPLALLEYIVKTYSNPGDHVLDFCMGSGTTGAAAVELGRDFTGFELDKTHFDTAKIRVTSSVDAIVL